MSTEHETIDRPVLSAEWPAEDLETLGRCPACGETGRSVRFDNLVDKAFFADGRWTLYDCQRCAAAYLDPRPSVDSIGRAYANYYTHGASYDHAGRPAYWEGSSLRARIKARYLNDRYGYAFKNALPFGSIITRAVPRVARVTDYYIRHLPAPAANGDKLLDVGSGSGDFLAVAKALGYRPMGLDPDQAAVEHSRRHGLDVRQGLLPDPNFTERGFAQITLSHVLEHLHKPREAVRQMLEMLTPGGRLWLSQPNLGASGLQRFGADWRGLEPPRHLSLYDFKGLSRMLNEAGFTNVRQLAPDMPAGFFYRQSEAMRQGVDPYRQHWEGWTPELDAEAAAANKKARRNPDLAENLTVVAFRPAA